jgi:hypothetical protein
MVTAFQRQQSSARLFYLRLHLCTHLGHRQAMAPATAPLAGRSRFKLASTLLIRTHAGGRRARTSRVISSAKSLCSGFRPGLDRGTERNGFTQSGASMEAAALGCGNENVQNLRCFLDAQFLKLGHFDDRAYTRAESTTRALCISLTMFRLPCTLNAAR